NVKFNIFPFFQRFEPVPLECRIVHKHVLARFQSNETKPLAIVEPFDSALGFHPALLLSRVLEPCVSSRPATERTACKQRLRHFIAGSGEHLPQPLKPVKWMHLLDNVRTGSLPDYNL